MTKKVALVETAVTPLTSGDLMHAPVEDLSTSSVVETWLMLDLIEGMVEERKKALRERLLLEAKNNGEQQTESGSFKMNVHGSTVLRERREAKQIDVDKMTELMNAKGIDPSLVIDKVTTYAVNLSKVANLVANGVLTQEEVDNLKTVTWALRVTASKEFKKMLEEAKEASKNKLTAGKG